MFCPNCGSNNSGKENYCRSCGLSLEKVTLVLSEQVPSQMSANLRSQKERFEKLGMAALSVFGLGLVGLLLYLIVYKTMIAGGRFWEGLAMLGVMILMSFGLIAVYLFAKANDVGKGHLPVENDDDVETIKLAASTRELLPESRFEPIPSIVEETTELLKSERKPRTAR
jgi:hypothetical protein